MSANQYFFSSLRNDFIIQSSGRQTLASRIQKIKPKVNKTGMLPSQTKGEYSLEITSILQFACIKDV